MRPQPGIAGGHDVREALGASRATTLRRVVGEGLRLLAAGLGVGVLAALSASSVVQSLLYGVTPTAPHTFVIVSLVLGAVTMMGTAIPAYRASRVDPAVALRD